MAHTIRRAIAGLATAGALLATTAPIATAQDQPRDDTDLPYCVAVGTWHDLLFNTHSTSAANHCAEPVSLTDVKDGPGDTCYTIAPGKAHAWHRIMMTGWSELALCDPTEAAGGTNTAGR
ncbi:hypothetical protein RM844_31915 [Streptomyces sp. DSM 44915]|uniref:Secreted protein n=1 Tax=Streptomyces chisholmiae TaxID=3075540 RepID=A0ABU2K0U8_9ACTN|nr:hypothetical protein [Streptomyces sp. DSM 44915]MDT0270886.1 hypothetical protein [Streptomyces sp. DSM 44915]